MKLHDFDLLADSPIPTIVSKLNEYGVVRILSYMEDVSLIKKELLSVYDKMEDNYPYGKAIRSDVPAGWDLSKTPAVSSFFRKSEWMREIATGYQDLKVGFQKDIFSTYDYLDDRGVGPQGWAHFDKLQRFKFFLNVTDVDEYCGPLMVSPKSHRKIKALKASEPTIAGVSKWRFGRFYGDSGVCEHWDTPQNHYPDIKYDLVPLIGPAGTLVMFDSDTIHKGGSVRLGNKRIVVRSHSW